MPNLRPRSLKALLSVYGWRSAEVINLSRMRQGNVSAVIEKSVIVNVCPDFPNTCQILLEQNYRSTAAILKASLAIVAEGA